MDVHLDRADYRRRVAEMYLAEPREGEAAWHDFRARRDRLFIEHSQSPVEETRRATLDGLPYFPYDPRYRVEAKVEKVDDDPGVSLDSGGEDGLVHCVRVRRLTTEFGTLTLFWITGYGGGLFLPFRDGTSGRQTYGGGRYLTDTIKGTHGRGVVVSGETITLDFNYSYNPSCAYNSMYACPLAPYENHLSAPILAGELAFPEPV